MKIDRMGVENIPFAAASIPFVSLILLNRIFLLLLVAYFFWP